MDPRSAEESIERTIEAFQDGWNRQDLEACASAFSRDADFVSAGGWWRGRNEIAGRIGGQLAGGAFRTTRVSIRFLRTDVAVVHVGWESTGGAPRRRGLMTWIMCRGRGRWAVEAAQNADQNDTTNR